MNHGALDEQKSGQSTSQKDHKDEESNSTGITEQRTLQQQGSSRGRTGGAPYRRADNRNWQDKRDQRVRHDHTSMPLPSKRANQSHISKDERLNRDQEIVGFLNRKLKQDKQVVTDTNRSLSQEEQHSGVLLCATSNREANFGNKEGASATISGQKEFDATSYGKKNSYIRRQKETNYNNRGRGQRGRQNFSENFVNYPRIQQKSHIKYHGEDYNYGFNNSLGQNYRGSRSNFNQTKNKLVKRSKKAENRDQTSRSAFKLTEDEAAGSDKSEISNISNHHDEFNSDRLKDETSSINDQSKVNIIDHTTVKPGEIFMHNQSLGAMKKHSDNRSGLSRNFERNSNYGRLRRNFNERMKPWKQVKNVSKFQSEQAGALIEQLRSETYECMVCYDGIRCSAAIWSCSNCYHVFHLKCIRKWANSPSAVVEGDDGGWRCPACQNIVQQVPNAYWCYCGKVMEPRWNIRDGITPHSCGELCQKRREVNNCPHPCNQLCHPGPCPSCPAVVSKTCACGKTKMQIRCGQSYSVLCKELCKKLLNCQVHQCTIPCHTGPCSPCDIQVKQECYCGKDSRKVLCGEGEKDTVNGKDGYFSCQQVCERFLDCGKHKCEGICHQGPCIPCPLKPSLVTHCPCGKTSLDELLGKENLRVSCTDRIPTCNYICGKRLPCSPQGSNGRQHTCKKPCHHGECGPCDGNSIIKCRCGAKTKEIPCVDRKIKEQFLCERRCNKKKQCGRHRCNQKCCVDIEHNCELICGKKLRCGQHYCEEPCHPGHCHRCWNVSFDELTCYCGASILYPPIPCGATPPICSQPCSRQHACSHPVNHTCHNEEFCPPCPMLTKKMCLGQHEMRYNIPCHVTDVTCGNPCGKTLPCGHTCPKSCHKGLCSKDPCKQPCKEKRKECGHPCGVPCHMGSPCPSVPCKVKITVSCQCGRKAEKVPCLQGGDRAALTQAYQRLATETLANKMQDLQAGISIDVSTIMHFDEKKPRQIECDGDCEIYQRNRRLAEALQIEDADFSPQVGPYFSPFLLDEAKRNLGFVKSVEEALENLIAIVSKSQYSQRTHNFQPMNSNQRRVIHEMAAIYNCTTRSYDQEPLRSTVVTATKESKLPNTKLSSKIEQELNPAPPQPVPFLPSKILSSSRSKEPKTNDVKKEPAWAQVPDYFADDFDD